MRRKTLITGILFVLLLVFLWQLNQRRQQRQLADERARQVFRFEPQDAARLTLSYPGQTIVCQRMPGDTWEIVQPIKTRCDEAALWEMITGLHELRIDRIVAESKDLESGRRSLAEYGLDSPDFTVHLDLAAGVLDTLVVGTKSHTTAYTFAARSGESKVLLVLTSSVENIRKGLYDLRDKHLLDFDPQNVAQVGIEYGNQRVECAKAGSDWLLTHPIQARADQAEMDSLLTRAKEALATRFVAEKADDLTKFGLDQPALKLTLRQEADETPKSLLIGSKIEVKYRKEGAEDQVTEEYFAKQADKAPIFMVTTEAVDALRKSPFELRDRAVVVFERRSVERIELARGAALIVCQKDSAGAWQMTAPFASKAKDWRVNGLLADLKALKAADFVSESPRDLSPYGLGEPAIKVRLMRGTSPLAELWVGARKHDKVYVKSADSDWVYLVDDDILNELTLDPDDLADTAASDPASLDQI